MNTIPPAALPGILADQIALCDDANFTEAQQTLATFERDHATPATTPPSPLGRGAGGEGLPQANATPDESLHEHLSAAHLQLLTALDDHENPDAAEPHLDALRRLHELHPANPRILSDYANALAHHHDAWLTATDSDPARAATPLQTLLTLAEKHPAHDLSEQIADAHYNQFHHYITAGEPRAAATIQARLAAHHALHPANPRITHCLAQAHLLWVLSHANKNHLPRAAEACGTLETFIEKHISPLPPEARHNLRAMQIHALATLVETAASRSNTGNNPLPSDPAAIATAETHYAKLRAIAATLAGTAHDPRNAEKFADASIALYNHYNLAAATAPAAEKYHDLEHLHARYPGACAAHFSRALYGQITAATGERRFADAEQLLATFEQHFAAPEHHSPPRAPGEIPEPAINLARASSALASAYGDAARLADAARHAEKIGAILGRTCAPGADPAPALLHVQSTTLRNLAIDCARAADYPGAIARHADLADVAACLPNSETILEDHAVDLKNKNHPQRHPLTAALYSDIRAHAARWPLPAHPAAKPIHDTLKKLATLLATLPPQPPPLPPPLP